MKGLKLQSNKNTAIITVLNSMQLAISILCFNLLMLSTSFLPNKEINCMKTIQKSHLRQQKSAI